MTYRQGLLTQMEPLEPHEVADLEDWLLVLQQDCEDFGPAPEDLERMKAIEDKIFQARNP
jgi:hypothetical protein